MQTWLTHPLSFLFPLLSSNSIPLPLSLSPSSACSPGSPPLPPIPPPSFPPILSGLIVLHLFIQAFMAASSSCKPISPPDDGFLPQLSWLFIISVNPHHISLTLGRWFSHWTALLTRHITNPPRSSHKHMRSHTKGHSQKGNLTSLYYTADLLAAKMLSSVLKLPSGIL